MRSPLLRSLMLAALAPAAAFAQEGGGAPSTRPFMQPDTGLMVWTLLIFIVLMFVLSKYAFGPITAAVEKREKTLQDALDSAKRDREAAATLLAEHVARIDAARGDAQKLIADGRAVAEKMRADLLEHTRKEQQEMLERARGEIESEKQRAIAQLRRDAVDLALAGASRVIEQNLESQKNRQLIESYLSSIGTVAATN